MDELPKEYELLEFFGKESIKQDKDVPFYYNNFTYKVINYSEKIEINISLACNEIEIF